MLRISRAHTHIYIQTYIHTYFDAYLLACLLTYMGQIDRRVAEEFISPFALPSCTHLGGLIGSTSLISCDHERGISLCL